LLQELVETYSEVEMAKDALAKKAVEIAVPLEEAAAEDAEELTTHIEKWLPDTPDREQWSMEEVLGESETPMAELPGELEDLIGELMEEEEDIFEEMEDVSSGHADSIDKGAGWDAADGPISNMSAQGVTGNRLPNSSEVSGRSGEGRTGKSAGEMVENTATGKGGRRTPTRLTQDQFQSGQIDDQSKDPAGGATGGGKAGGAGDEGLEGPAPPTQDAEARALSGKQAQLRNKLERVQIQMRVGGYSSPYINSAIEALRESEAAVNSGRYQDAARHRAQVVENLRKTRQFVAGVKRYRIDPSTLPKGLEDEMLDAAGAQAPEGFEDLLQGYYQAIRGGE
jgi:hypothetical protein